MISASRILVTGGRGWTRGDIIAKALAEFSPTAVVVHGACRGADTLADKEAKRLGMKTCPYPANWETYGRAAGPIRNREMLDTNPDYVLAFHEKIQESRGTKDCINEAVRRGIPVFLFNARNDVSGIVKGRKPGVTQAPLS